MPPGPLPMAFCRRRSRRFASYKSVLPPARALLPVTLVFLALVWIFGAGCGGDAGSGQVTNTNPLPPLDVDSGSFELVSEVLFNGCGSSAMFDGTYEIRIEESGFSMGDWSGEWSATSTTLTAHGESLRSQRTTRGCTITTWTEVSLTFTSRDRFYGHVIYRYRVSGTCDCCTNCQSTWSITGARVTT